MKKLILSLVVVLFFATTCFAQPKPKDANAAKPKFNLKEKLYYGANVSLSFGTNSGVFDLSPNLGYKINDMFSVGPQVIYTNYIFKSGNTKYNFNIIGGGIFARALVLPNIFLQAEYDILSVPKTYVGNKVTERVYSDEKMVGIGLKNQFGEKACYYFTIMYDIAPTQFSPYNNGVLPIVYRTGFNINF